jgi:hypothetical protein
VQDKETTKPSLGIDYEKLIAAVRGKAYVKILYQYRHGITAIENVTSEQHSTNQTQSPDGSVSQGTRKDM